MTTRVILKNVRLSYVNLLEPRLAMNKQSEEFSASLILDPDEPTTQALLDAVEEVAIEKFGDKAPGLLERGKIASPVHSGDEEREDDEAYAGKLYCNAKSKRRPGLVNRRLEPVLEDDEVYSGVYANVSVSLYGYEYEGRKGVGVGLNNVQVTELADRLAGGPSAEEEFEVLEDEPKNASSSRPRKEAPARSTKSATKVSKAEYEDEDEDDDFDDAPPPPPARRGFKARR